MRILALKPGHDGAVALIEDGRLCFSLEAEKDSNPRHSDVSAPLVVDALQLADGAPDVIALSGWKRRVGGRDVGIGAGYLGLDVPPLQEGRMFGRAVTLFSSSHERSHLLMATAMAPSAPIEECAIVVWEGIVGALYHWRRHGVTIERTQVLDAPGARYRALFALAEPSFPDRPGSPLPEYAGKLMALAGFADDRPPAPAERATVDHLLATDAVFPFDKPSLRGSPLHNCGVESPGLHRAARYLTDRIFERFRDAARISLPRGLPLLISGGCGLNCEWNRRWRESGLFSETFVVPCLNDTGAAIGTAVDAQVALGGPPRLRWQVYAGAPFVSDGVPDESAWDERPLALDAVARRLAGGEVVAWVRGRCEIGPRALGHRSLLASPLAAANHDVLNAIKGRESYRPIAPCCLLEDLGRYFEPAVEDPYMLHFSRVISDAIPAVTHVDGTARVQSVGPRDDAALRSLLQAFRAHTGHGVLCNTSLNFQGAGFINRASDLFAYCEAHGVDEVVVEDRWYTRRGGGR